MPAPTPTPLVVAFDVGHERQTAAGTTRVSQCLLAALSSRDDVRVVPIGGGPLAPRGTAQQRWLALRQDLVWYPFGARRAARRVGAAVQHSGIQRGPLRAGEPPLVIIVHDALALRAPETMSRWNLYYTRATQQRLFGAAARIVCPSVDTARDLVEYGGVEPDRIRVIPWGVAERFRQPPPAATPVPAPYVLAVATLNPRKNLERLAAACGTVGVPLVIAGDRGWLGGAPANGDVHLLGRVDDATLHALYAHATCLAVASLHEGFGLPVLEAMAVGCPVVAGHVGALPEVAGDAAILVDPTSTDAIAAGLRAATERREALISAGRQRAAGFTWRNAADAMVAVWREAAAM